MFGLQNTAWLTSCFVSQEKLHKLEHALVDSKDDKAAEKSEAQQQRDREAEEKLKYLQCEFLCVYVCVCHITAR